MDPITGNALLGAGMSGLGMLGQRQRNQRAMNQQMQLMDHQYGNQQQLMQQQLTNQTQLNQQGHDMQYDMWLKTNYPAQVEMMREAGLNPALMYKQGGPGGVTGNQGGGTAGSGNASGGQAPQQPPMDIMLMGAQLNKLNAEKENIEEDTKNKGEERKETIERQNKLKQEVDNLIQDKKLSKAQEELANSKKAREDLEKDIRQLDKDFFDDYNISNAEYGWIESLRIGGWKLADILNSFFDWNWGDDGYDIDAETLRENLRKHKNK